MLALGSLVLLVLLLLIQQVHYTIDIFSCTSLYVPGVSFDSA
jgi:hypothetical protein